MRRIIREILILIGKRAFLRLAVFALADAVFISISAYLAFLLRFEGQIPSQHFPNIAGMIVLTLIISLPIFYFLKLYSFTWIYVSTEELVSLAKGVALSFLIVAASIFVLRDYFIFVGLPRSALFVSYFLIFIFSGGIRFAKRIYLQIFSGSKKRGKERTLIAGAGDAGEQILRSILSSKISPYLPIGFVDDNPVKKGILIHGIKVLGKIEDIPQIVKEKRIEGLIVALPSAGSSAIRGAVGKGRSAGLKKIKVVPSIDEVINGQVGLVSLREVEVEDLLGREPVVLDPKSIENFIQNKKVLITGAAGSIGSELSRQTAKFRPSSLLLLDQDETGIFNVKEELEDRFPGLNIETRIINIQDQAGINRVFESFRPAIVFHAAAYKHVPLMEAHPESAVKNNIIGTKILTEAALKYETEKFIFISTDKAVNPTSVMGATKRIGEMICRAENQKGTTKFVSVRFGNVLDSRGSVIPVFRDKIRKREPIEITHPDMQRFFMTIPEACLLVLLAGAMGQGGEVFVLDMGDPVKIIDLAKELIRLSGLEPDKDIPIVFTEPRPGEKLFEELLTAEEGTISTQNQKIFMAKPAPVDKEKLFSGVEEFQKSAYRGDKEYLIKKLKELIPTYTNG